MTFFDGSLGIIGLIADDRSALGTDAAAWAAGDVAINMGAAAHGEPGTGRGDKGLSRRLGKVISAAGAMSGIRRVVGIGKEITPDREISSNHAWIRPGGNRLSGHAQVAREVVAISPVGKTGGVDCDQRTGSARDADG